LCGVGGVCGVCGACGVCGEIGVGGVLGCTGDARPEDGPPSNGTLMLALAEAVAEESVLERAEETADERELE